MSVTRRVAFDDNSVLVELYGVHDRNLARIEQLANDQNISLRTGCFCNPGAGETALGLTKTEIECALEKDQRMTLPELMIVMGRVLGALRISVGIASNFADVHRFMQFARTFVDQTADTL